MQEIICRYLYIKFWHANQTLEPAANETLAKRIRNG